MAVKWFALRAGVGETRGKTRREDLRGGLVGRCEAYCMLSICGENNTRRD